VELANKYNSQSDPMSTLSGKESLGLGSNPVPGPMVVHCSAGCGRTGAFCVIDTIIKEMKLNREQIFSKENRHKLLYKPEDPERQPSVRDDIWNTVSTFREQRPSMVQTLRQYVFCYEAILWHLILQSCEDKGESLRDFYINS